MNHLTIITGASRGLGAALTEQLLLPHNHLLCISRRSSAALADRAVHHGAHLEQWTMDLDDAVAAAARLTDWFATHPAGTFSSATLINNACAIPALVPLRDSQPAELARVMRVGLEAPLLLSAAFLDATRHWTVPRKILNISSGLGRRAMASQAAYCAIKAGMDHFTRALAMDEALVPHGAKVCSLAPGVIDTDMQTHLRQSDPAGFPDLALFQGMHSQGQLSSPAHTSQQVLAYLERPDFGNNPIGDVRDSAAA